MVQGFGLLTLGLAAASLAVSAGGVPMVAAAVAAFGCWALLAALATPVPFLVLVLPFSNFILDTTVTLIRRMLRGEKWYQAHRSHFYQRMTNLGMSHAKVTGLELGSVAVSCLAAAVYLASGYYWKIAVVTVVSAGFVSAGILISRKENPQPQKKGRSCELLLNGDRRGPIATNDL